MDEKSATPQIDGIGLHQMAWVRTTNGEDIDNSGPVLTTSTRPVSQTLAALSQWARTDGHDTSTALPNFRNTSHGALNHHVRSHNDGNWDEKPIVIVAPLNAMIEANGPPTKLRTVDTWWALPPDGSLKLPGATMIAPDTSGTMVPDAEIRSSKGSTIYYPVTFDDARQAKTLDALTPEGRTTVLHNVNARLDKAGEQPVDVAGISAPRQDRSGPVNVAIDGELSSLAKKLAVNQEIRKIGPVCPGGMHAWGDRDLTADTERLAAKIGSGTGQHSHSPEQHAVYLMETGKAAEVREMADVSPATKSSAVVLEGHSGYRAFAKALQVDKELSMIAGQQSGKSTISPAGAERLAVMAERTAAGQPSPIITPRDYDRNRRPPVDATSPMFVQMAGFAKLKYADDLQVSTRLEKVDTSGFVLVGKAAPGPAQQSPKPPPLPPSVIAAAKLRANPGRI